MAQLTTLEELRNMEQELGAALSELDATLKKLFGPGRHVDFNTQLKKVEAVHTKLQSEIAQRLGDTQTTEASQPTT